MDKVSIIVPVYNGEEYLERCINSLINQTYSNLELIFINDGSKDGSLSILKKFKKKDCRILIIDKKNTGVSDSRNIGIKRSTGRYICFCDCDDFYDDNYVEIMYKCIKENKVDVVRCNYKVIDKTNRIINGDSIDISNKLIYKKNIINSIIPKCLEGKIPSFIYLVMIDRKKLNIEFPTDISMMEDCIFYIKLFLCIDNMYIINNALYNVVYNEQGATNNVNNYKRNILNILEVNIYVKDILKTNNILTRENIQKLNINNLNGISDFIFKYYLCNGTKLKELCVDIRCDNLLNIIEETNLNYINLQRRIILKLLNKKKYNLLFVYLCFRKLLHNLRRR